MSYYSGYQKNEVPESTPRLTSELELLVLGTAIKGPIGNAIWISTVDQANFVYGGTQTYRLSPTPEQTYQTLVGFSPDDPTLNTASSTKVYTYNSGSVYPTRYGFFNTVSGNGFYPPLATFDAIGYSASSQPGIPGIFIESESAFTLTERNSGVSTGLLFPLTSLLRESEFSIATQRVGTSWLPLTPSTLLAFINGQASSGTGPIFKFIANSTGDTTTNDLYLSCSVSTSPQGITFDPGTLGLPSSYRFYTYSNYSTWTDLINDITQDGQTGVIPFQLTNVYNLPILGVIPSGTGSTTTHPFYTCQPSTAPNLTTASGWASVLNLEALALENPAFILCSGLTGLELATDPASTLSILQSLYDGESSSLCSPGPILIAPWSLIPPSGSYDPTSDIALATNLSTYLGQYANSLCFIWGSTYQIGCPDILVNSPTNVPSAYIAPASILNPSQNNPLRPVINTILSNAPWFEVGELTGFGVPTSTQLVSLHAAGINSITKKIDGTWTLFGPIQTLSGESLGIYLAVKALEENIRSVSDNYIGQVYSASLQTSLQAKLNSVASNTISPLIQSVSLTVLTPDITKPITFLEVSALLNLYGETRAVQFIVNIDF